MSGLIADAKTLIDKARVETQVWEHTVIQVVCWPCGLSAANLCPFLFRIIGSLTMRPWQWKVWLRLCPTWHCNLGRRMQTLVPWSVTLLISILKYSSCWAHVKFLFFLFIRHRWHSNNLCSIVSALFLCAVIYTESTIRCCTSFWWSWWKRTSAVCNHLCTLQSSYFQRQHVYLFRLHRLTFFFSFFFFFLLWI